MLRRALRKMRYAVLLLKVAGPRAFFFQLRRQLYSRDILLGLEKRLDKSNGIQIFSKLKYVLQKATENDLVEILSKVKEESKESAYELIERAWFFESGFRDCYIARVIDIEEPCFVAWLVSPEDSNSVSEGFNSRLPQLDEAEVLLENCYTFEKYRGNNIMPTVVAELCELAKNKGFKRLIAYVRKDNIASLRAFEKLDVRKFEETPELKMLFCTKRKHNKSGALYGKNNQ
jgi:hypothetical protein